MAHCAFIRRFVGIWRRSLPLQLPDIPLRKHQSPREGIKDAICREFDDLLDRWRKLTDETYSEFFKWSEIGESALLGKAIPHALCSGQFGRMSISSISHLPILGDDFDLLFWNAGRILGEERWSYPEASRPRNRTLRAC